MNNSPLLRQFAAWLRDVSRSCRLRRAALPAIALWAVTAFSPLLLPTAFAAEESCASCDKKISFSGDFVHRRVPGSVTIEGAPAGTESYYREGIYGASFTATISGLPDGRFTITVGLVEASSDNTTAGQRVFDIFSGDQPVAKGVDIITAAGGPNKVHFVSGTVQHQADTLAGPLVLNFLATAGMAKLNTLEIKDANSTSVAFVHVDDLVDQSDAAARQIPQIAGALWLDPSAPRAARVKDLISRMSLAEKVRQMGNGSPAIHRAGLDLPAYDYWSEGLHGVANTRDVTVFPQAIANGATWDTNIIKLMGHFIGIEARATNNAARAQHNGDSTRFHGLNFWSPNINIYRDPRWGRGQETYGEDTFLTSRMGVAFIRGLQGDDPNYVLALACAKHYAVHSGPEALRHQFDVYPSERDLYETYLPHFEAAVVEGHVGAIMSAYNAVDGEPAPSSTLLLTDILRIRWGFDGQVVSDCDAVGDIWRNHHTVPNAAEAAARAVIAGTDLCCGQTYNSLLASVRSNYISTAQIDTALGRILESRFKLGLFDPPEKVSYLRIPLSEKDTPEHRAVALKMAEEALVLLKNDGLLPLNSAKAKKIAVFGENATSRTMLYGNYNGTASAATTILQGIQAEATNHGVEVTYAEGCPLVVRGTNAPAGGGRGGRGFGGAPATPPRPLEELKAEALSNAANADILIYVGGINSQLEGEEGNARASGGIEGFSNGDRTRIELPQVQEDFLHTLQATGKPVIFVNCSGGAMAVPWEAEHLNAILQAWYPGEEGGKAVGEVLFGDCNPSGRLPLTFYASTADLPVFTNYSMVNRTYRYFTGKPLFAFGHGLSYTSFDYAKATVSSPTVKADALIKVTVDVRNSGKLAGDEVAQVYFRHVDSKVSQPNEALCGFARCHLQPGQSRAITIDIPAERLRYWDTDKRQYVVEAGKYEFLIGAASDDIRLKLPLAVVAP